MSGKLLVVFGALTLGAVSALLLMAAHPAQAQTGTVLYNFTSTTRVYSDEPVLTADGAGNLYGIEEGGALGGGAVFELSPNGGGGWSETVVYTFCSQPNCADGSGPIDSVIFDSFGNLYGVTDGGGATNSGVVYQLSPTGGSWTETVLVSLGTSFWFPLSGIIRDAAGNIYGTTYEGFAGHGVFEVSPSGGWTQQVIFDEGRDDNPYAGLTMDAAGNIFAVSLTTVFELSPNGAGGWTHAVLHTFTGGLKDGSDPYAGVVLDQAGNLYGTTLQGGAKGGGTVYKLSRGRNGTWTEKILHSFQGGRDGTGPVGAVVLDKAGNIYGTAQQGGGKLNDGIVFKLAAPGGSAGYKVLWTFNGKDGNWPSGSLILDSTGRLYGIAPYGGANGYGVVFEVTP